MTDVDALLREFLASQVALTTLVGARIFASVDLPAGYDPQTNGPAVLFSARASGGQDFSSHVLVPSYQFLSYAATEKQAREVDRALYDVLNDAKWRKLKSARMETFGQMLTEPETGWPFVLTYYRCWVAN